MITTKHMSKKDVSILFLSFALITSLIMNIEQSREEEKNLYLRGTYQATDTNTCLYLLMNEKGNFCRYTQTSGVLNYGEYQGDKREYKLMDEKGNQYSLLLYDGGAYLFDATNNTLTKYEKINTALIFLDIPGEWPSCISP